MSLLEVNGLAFAYGDKPVFEDASFSVEQGRIFCLVGPNGCGKTTLEHCLLAHVKPQRGSISIDGRDLSAFSSRQLAAEIAYVPQNHVRSFPYRTVDMVAMGCTRQQRFLETGAGSVDRARSTMEQLGIEHLADIEYTTLSGGELQMALVARALVQDSRILVLDEPTAHLDVKRGLSILLTLRDLACDRGKTIVLSTHDFNQPLMLQDEGADVRMALMENGTLSEAGAPLDMLSSSCLNDLYGIQSQIVELANNPARHYLAMWADDGERQSHESLT